jgi:hypothetical protein
MYALIRHYSARQIALQHAPAVGGSLVIAELFYKFHSFTLECLAFLATWFVIDAALHLVRRDPASRSAPRGRGL